MDGEQILELFQRLMKATSFEQAALDVLGAALDGLAPTSQRATLHLRPGGTYANLAVRERDREGLSRIAQDDALLPSATAWRWVARTGAPVCVDVNLGVVMSKDPPSGGARSTGDGSFDGAASLVRLQGRGTTHLVAIPLHAPGGTVTGMIAVELVAPDFVGRIPAAGGRLDHLQLIADVCAPYLFQLPARSSAPILGDTLLPVVGASMEPTIRLLRVFAGLEETILISGPTGAGKSRLAAWCHQRSPQRDGPFETLDIHTVPAATQMGELFGWRPGAFTGATHDNPGHVGRAEGGTLFLDEIDKLSMGAQSALLRLLETKTYRVLGDAKGARAANVRFIVGTNVNLQDAVQAGTFREDLYYRINVLPVRVLPLAERRDEIGDWATFFLERRHRRTHPTGTAEISAAGRRALEAEPWPGNLRQLDNVIRRAYAMLIAERGAVPDDVQVDAQHLERGLGLEVRAATLPLLAALRRAAAVFVDEAVRRAPEGRTLDLDLADAFRGLVLEGAIERIGDRKGAYELFGRDKSVSSRNYIREIRRELDRVSALVDDLSE